MKRVIFGPGIGVDYPQHISICIQGSGTDLQTTPKLTRNHAHAQAGRHLHCHIIGLAIISRKSRSQTAIVAIGWWLLGLLVLTGMTVARG